MAKTSESNYLDRYQVTLASPRQKKHIWVYGASDGHGDSALCNKDVTDCNSVPMLKDSRPDVRYCSKCVGLYVIATRANVVVNPERQ